MKIIAFYLPQFHNIPENDEWWGDGFTEWTNVKKAKPIYKGHIQPKVPLNKNYYNLLDDNVKIWQAHLAQEYGIYGFCYYHYWFNGKLLLEKPMEQMLLNKSIDIPFCICWANEPWTKGWVGEKKVLYPQEYGSEQDWIDHFNYLLPFLKDERYIKKDGKPIIFFYKPELVNCLSEMITCWQKCAHMEGLDGLTFLGKFAGVGFEQTEQYKVLDYVVEWQPSCIKISKKQELSNNPLKVIRRRIYDYVSEKLGINAYEYSLIKKFKDLMSARIENYDDIWKDIISSRPLCEKSIPGAFVRWDTTPRYGRRATIIKGETPIKFREFLFRQIKHAREDYHEDMMFLFAWNEWAEGGYLEPDEESGYAYLEAIRDALKDNKC